MNQKEALRIEQQNLALQKEQEAQAAKKLLGNENKMKKLELRMKKETERRERKEREEKKEAERIELENRLASENIARMKAEGKLQVPICLA